MKDLTTAASFVLVGLAGFALAAGAEPLAPLVLARGPHHRVVQTVAPQPQADGTTYYTTNTYTEIANGMHFMDATGNWIESKEEIEIINGVGVARQGQHRVIFAASASDVPAIDMQMPDGNRLQSRVAGISYLDRGSGQSAWVALVHDAAGQVQPPNVVIYPAAFGNDLRAAIRCTYTKYGFAQDLLLQEQLLDPGALNPPLNADNVLVQLWTEFFSPPAPRKQEITVYQENDPAKRQQMAVPDLLDEYLDFGGMQMAQGVALSLSESGDPMNADGAVRVCKTWVDDPATGRHFLVENVPYAWLQPLLQGLPPKQAARDQPKDALWARVRPDRATLLASLPRPERNQKRGERLQLAKGPKTKTGRSLLIDYTTINGNKTNWVFAGDQTFYVSGPVILTGATNATVFEGGTVLKFSPTNTAKLTVQNQINWQGTAFRPVLMSARDDVTVGQKVATNAITSYDTALYINAAIANTNAILHHLRVAYATNAIVLNGNTGHVISHAQFVNCQNGINATNTVFSLRNALFHNVSTVFNAVNSTGHCEHLTVDTANWLNYSNYLTLNLTNSLLVSVTNAFTLHGSNSVSSVSSSSGVFTTVGAGYHYLADNTYRNRGAPNINASLAADLAAMTTYPPILLTNDFTAFRILAAQAILDASPWALGYHYCPLHYAWTKLNVTNNATLLLTNGVAIANYGTLGLTIWSGSKIIGEGSPTNLNRLVPYNTVQEQSVAWGAGGAFTFFDTAAGSGPPPEIRLRFTDLAQLANVTSGWTILNSEGYATNTLALTDCQLRGGYLSMYSASSNAFPYVAFTNNLALRTDLHFTQGYQTTPYPASLYLRNNLFWGGSLSIVALSANNTWETKDNLFDTVSLTTGGTNSAIFANSNNGYYSTTQLPVGSNNKTLTAVDYQSGPLGNFYYPTNGTNLNSLRDAGSLTNAGLVGLYHYTTTTNQVPETNSVLDIGRHQVATDAAGNPLDFDADSLSNWYEDRDGDGVFDAAAGETDWQNAYTSTNGLNDLQNWELASNVQVNDPMQDIGTDQNTQNETAVIAFGQNVIAVYKSSNKNVAGFGPPDFSCPDGPWYPPIVPQGDGWAVSHDGGVTFTDKGTFPVLSNVVVFVQTADNGSSGYFVTTNMGDIADPALARDNTSGAIYFAALTQRSSVYYPNGTNQPGRIYAPVWRSINNGDTVQAPVNASAGLTNQAWNDITDGPVVVVDNFPGTGQGDVYLSFAWLHPQSDIILCRSTNGGLDWQIIQQITNVCRGNVFMTTNHEVCVGWQPVQDCAHGQQAYTNTLYIDRSTNRGLSFYTTNVTHLVSNGGTNKFTRSVTAPSDDQFFGGVGSFALNPANGNFYYAYYDQPPSGTNRPNIYLRQLTNGVDWTDPIQVNVEPGGVATDQWQPTITVKPDGTKLFVAWYDRRDDPTNHYLIRMYGGFAALPITGSNAFATNFAISTASFPPVFAGTTMTGTNQFDPVYPPFPRNDGTYCPNFGGIFSPYTMGDYNRAFSENSYVHFTWGDNRNNYTATNGFTRNQADVRFIRLSWPR